jgi:hypothetical protein
VVGGGGGVFEEGRCRWNDDVDRGVDDVSDFVELVVLG